MTELFSAIYFMHKCIKNDENRRSICPLLVKTRNTYIYILSFVLEMFNQYFSLVYNFHI